MSKWPWSVDSNLYQLILSVRDSNMDQEEEDLPDDDEEPK